MKLKWRDIETPWGAPGRGFALNLGEVKVLRIFVCCNPLRGSLAGTAGDWLLSLNNVYTRWPTEEEALAHAEQWFAGFVKAVLKYSGGSDE